MSTSADPAAPTPAASSSPLPSPLDRAAHRSSREKSSIKDDPENATMIKPDVQATEVDVFAAENGGVEFRTLTWPHASVIIAKLQIGVGVLGIAGTFDTLGFAPGLISLIIISFITTYAGILAGRIRLLHPNVHSPAELGNILCGGSRIGAALFGFFYWILLVMIAGSGMLSTSIALNAVSTHAICTMGFVGVVAAACFIIGGGVRQLLRIAWLGWIGIFAVMASIWILTIGVLTKSYPMASLGQSGSVQVQAANTETTFAEAMAAVVTQLFALLGNVAYYSISAEMKNPAEFDRAVYCGQAFVIANYIAIASIVYAKVGQFVTSPALGSAGPLLKKVCYGFALPAVLITAIMYTHMATKQMFVTLLRNTRHLTTPTATHWGVWLGSNILVIALGFVLAASIPIFDNLLSLIGATVGCFFAVIVGGLTLLYLVAREEEDDDDDDAMAATAEVAPAPMERCDDWITRSFHNAWRSPSSTSGRKWRYLCAIFFLAAGLFLLGGGTYGAIVAINDAYKTGAVTSAFACSDNSGSV